MKTPAGEAEVEADPANIKEAMDLIPELMSKLAGGASRPLRSSELADQVSLPRSPESMPTVAVDKNDSLADIIGKFFADPWGRQSQKLSDVREALQSYGLNYPKQSVAVALLRLAKTTKIRRFKAEDGEYVYTASSVAPAAQD